MEKIFEKIINKDEWTLKDNGNLCVWKKSPNGLIVRLVRTNHYPWPIVEFTGAMGTVTAFVIREPLLLLYINHNKVFLGKLLDFLSEQQKDVEHIVPEQFIGHIKDLALQYSAKETLDTIKEDIDKHGWTFTQIIPGNDRYHNEPPLMILENGWTCSNFWQDVTFFKKINGEIIMVVFPHYFLDFGAVTFYSIHTDFYVYISLNLAVHLLTNENLYAMLQKFLHMVENGSADTQGFITYLANSIKDVDNYIRFEFIQKENGSYVFGPKDSINYKFCYNPDTDVIRKRYHSQKEVFVLSDKEKEDIAKAVRKFDENNANANKTSND